MVGELIDPGTDTKAATLPLIPPSFLDDAREDLREFWLKAYRAGQVDPVTLDVVNAPRSTVVPVGNRAQRRAQKAGRRVRARA